MPHSPFLNNEPLLETQGYMDNPKAYPYTHGHPGIDLRSPTGRKLTCCIDDAIVHFVSYRDLLGRWKDYGAAICLDWGQGDGYIRFLYGHCQNRNNGFEGERVNPGMPLGESDNTGRSTAPHLHFEMRRFYHDKKRGRYYDSKVGAHYDLMNPLIEFFQKHKIAIIT